MVVVGIEPFVIFVFVAVPTFLAAHEFGPLRRDGISSGTNDGDL